MAFGGNAGPSGSMLDEVAYTPAPGSEVLVYDGDDASYRTSAGVFVKDADTTLLVSVVSPALLAYIDATLDGSAGDTGILTTAVPIAGQHGLPANFGPGRGNWGPGDGHRLSTDIQSSGTFAPVAGGQVSEILAGFGGGNLVLIYKNLATVDLTIFAVRVRYDNSIAY